MNTIELTERINAIRNAKGKKCLKHGNLLVKCRLLFSDIKEGSYVDKRNQSRTLYELTSDQIEKIVYTESKEVSEVLVRELIKGADKPSEPLSQNISQKDQLKSKPISPNKVSGNSSRNLTEFKNSIDSLELLNQINLFRHLECVPEMAHSDLRKIIKDEFDEEIAHNFIPEVKVYDCGRPSIAYVLTYDQARQVLVRESKSVRKQVMKLIRKLEEENTMLLQANYEANKALLEANKALLMKETEEADYYYELSEDLRSQLKEAKKGVVVKTETKVPEDYEFLCGYWEMMNLTRQEATIPQVIRWYGRREYDPLELIRYSEINMLPILQVDNGRGKLINSYHCKAWADVYCVHFHD